MKDRFEFVVCEKYHRRRVDEFLFDEFASLSKMYLRDVLKAEKCEVNGYVVNSGSILRQNDFVEIELDISRETAMKPQKMPINVVYEDRDLLVVDKPAGMLVHPTHRDKNGTLLNGLAYYLRMNGGDTRSLRPGLVHRLDKHTSGLMVISKTDRALRLLTGKFKKKTVRKRYFALLDGIVEKDFGEIIAPIARFHDEKIWNVHEDGKYAESRFWVTSRHKDRTLVELEPVTGRTNQLRIHCAFMGNPIVGDVKYGGKEFVRMCLHAGELAFEHPETRKFMEFTSELPVEFK
ncbi:MAG: RluA family pseudouridine synthase [Pyrinomonadaceae bacterium]|nr:RluA family pseudouridine synthase [Pyrinomonadaceae bacterium]